ncbi:MAG: hypothetical protein V4663_08920 [Bacteroidota bacterium]
MKNLYLIFLLPFLFFSCKKDDSTKIKEKTSKIQSLGGAIFSYNEKGDPLFITKTQDMSLYDAFGSGAIETRVQILRSFFEYQNDGKISSFTAMGLYNQGSSVPSPSYKYYDYSYPTADQTIVKFSEGISRLESSSRTSTFKLTSTNGLLTLIEVIYDDPVSNRYNQRTNRIEISYSGKNPSTISMYKLYSPTQGVEPKWTLVEKYDNFKYDNFSNPLYVAFNGKPNFYFAQFGEPNGYFEFINLYSISVNNPLSTDVKYYNYDGSFLHDGVITYKPKYDTNNNMIYYEGENKKLSIPYYSSQLRGMVINYY